MLIQEKTLGVRPAAGANATVRAFVLMDERHWLSFRGAIEYQLASCTSGLRRVKLEPLTAIKMCIVTESFLVKFATLRPLKKAALVKGPPDLFFGHPFWLAIP